MTKHVHAASMALYAQDAMETDKPWERWEMKYSTDKDWIPLDCYTLWQGAIEYRRKPKRISAWLMNGDVVSWPEPYTGALLLGTSYWSVGLTEVHRHTWSNPLIKAQGLLYLVKEDAKEALVARQLIFTQGMK